MNANVRAAADAIRAALEALGWVTCEEDDPAGGLIIGGTAPDGTELTIPINVTE